MGVPTTKFLIGAALVLGGSLATVAPATAADASATIAPITGAVAGLPVPVEVALDLPNGVTAKVAWTSKRKDCVFTGGVAAATTTVVCDAKTTTATTVTVTVTPSQGPVLVRSAAVTFDKTARDVAVTGPSIGGSVGEHRVCPGTKSSLVASVESEDGDPVKGVTVTFLRQAGDAAPARAATALTDKDGYAVTKPGVLKDGTYTVTTALSGAFAAASADGETAVGTETQSCTATLDATADDATVAAGQTVRVTGTLERILSGATEPDSPLVADKVSLFAKGADGRWKSAGSALPDHRGRFTLAYRPVTDVTLQARVASRKGLVGASTAEIAVDVSDWVTTVAITSSHDDPVTAGTAVTISGTARQHVGSDQPVSMPSGSPLKVTFPVYGGKSATATAKVKADGTFSVLVKPTGTGEVKVESAARTGWGASSHTVQVEVIEIATTLTTTLTDTTTYTGDAVRAEGLLTKGAGEPVANASVTVTYPGSDGKTLTAKGTTTKSGTYSVQIRPTSSGDVVVAYAGAAGLASAEVTTGVTVTDRTTVLSLEAAEPNETTGAVVLTGTLTWDDDGTDTPLAGSVIRIVYQKSETTTGRIQVKTNATGQFRATAIPVTGDIVATYAGVVGYQLASATVEFELPDQPEPDPEPDPEG